MSKREDKARHKLANPFYGIDYEERLDALDCVDLRDNFLRVPINSKYSKLVPISQKKKFKKKKTATVFSDKAE